MAEPERVRLLSLALGHSDGEMGAHQLASATGLPTASVLGHMTALVDVGLLSIVDAVHGPSSGTVFRPTHDALVRFGGLSSSDAAPSGSRAGVDNHERLLSTIVETLTHRFEGVVAGETVRDFVLESYDLLASRARVRQFLPQLTERFAVERLDALASLEAVGTRARDDVLFVCVRNAGRSQIAAALMRERVGASVRVRAAGSVPSHRLDPTVRRELERRGIDMLTEFPRPLTDEVVRASGVVVTMGCGDACPIVPGRRYLDWRVDDPVGRPAQEVRRIVEDISGRVERLIVEMGVAAS